jgi:hypothetical protein
MSVECLDRNGETTFSVSQKCVVSEKIGVYSGENWLGGAESAGKLTSREREGSVNDAGLDADRVPHIYIL